MKKYLITGASGPLGKGTVEFMLNKKVAANDIHVLVRDEKKVEDLKTAGVGVHVGNYDDYSSLVTAFTGVEKLVFVSGNDVFNRIPQHENVVNAAKEAGVKHFIYTSSERKNETDSSPIAIISKAHVLTEQWLKNSGMQYTILQNSLYMDLVPFMAGQAVETGVVYYPAQEGKASFLLRSEMAEVTANVILTEGHEGKTYKVGGATSHSFQDVATILSNLTKKEIAYISPAADEYVGALVGAGLPEAHAQMFVGMALAQAQEEFATTSNDVSHLLGRNPTTLEEYLEVIYAVK